MPVPFSMAWVGRGAPSGTVLGNQISCSSHWPAGVCRCEVWAATFHVPQPFWALCSPRPQGGPPVGLPLPSFTRHGLGLGLVFTATPIPTPGLGAPYIPAVASPWLPGQHSGFLVEPGVGQDWGAKQGPPFPPGQGRLWVLGAHGREHMHRPCASGGLAELLSADRAAAACWPFVRDSLQ